MNIRKPALCFVLALIGTSFLYFSDALAQQGVSHPLRFVISSEEDQIYTQSQWAGLCPYVEENLANVSCQVDFVDYSGLQNTLKNNSFDFGISNAMVFMTAAEDYGVVPLSALSLAEDRYLGEASVTFVLSENADVVGLKDLGNSRVAAISEASLSGWLYFYRQVEVQFGDPFKHIKQARFLKTSEAVFNAILSKEFDVGVMGQVAWERLIKKNGLQKTKFKVLYISDEAPGWMLYRRNDMSVLLSKKLLQALLTFSVKRPDQQRISFMPIQCLQRLKAFFTNADCLFCKLGEHRNYFFYGFLLLFVLMFILGLSFYIWFYRYRIHQASVYRRLLSQETVTKEKVEEDLLKKELTIRNVIDDQAQTKGELEVAKDQLLRTEKFKAIGQLSAGIAHEINNPLAALQANVTVLGDHFQKIQEVMELSTSAQEALLSGDEDKAKVLFREVSDLAREWDLSYVLTDVQSIYQESTEALSRMAQIVDDLRSFSKKEPENSHTVNVNEVVQSAFNIVYNELKYKTAIQESYDHALPLINGSVNLLTQAFVNILINAAQAIEKNGNVLIRTYKEGKWVKVEIDDDGCGIADKDLGRIFEPFFTTKKVGQSTGLGLSVAYDIVQKHHGDILVKSAVNEGTVATVCLPYSTN